MSVSHTGSPFTARAILWSPRLRCRSTDSKSLQPRWGLRGKVEHMRAPRTKLVAVWIGGLSLTLGSTGCDQRSYAPAPAPPPVAKEIPKDIPKEIPKEAPKAAPKEIPKDIPKPAPAAPAVKAVAKDMPLPADMVEFKAEINRASAQIDVVVSRLDALVNASKDLEKPSEQYTAAVMALDTESAGLKKRADDMRERGTAYFEAWEKGIAAITTPEVKDLALQRKAELASKYTELLTAMQETRAAYDPFAAGLQAIQTKLDDSLTVESIKALAPDIAKAKTGAKSVKDRIGVVLDKLSNVGGIYARP